MSCLIRRVISSLELQYPQLSAASDISAVSTAAQITYTIVLNLQLLSCGYGCFGCCQLQEAT